MRRFVFQDEKSHKFWEISQDGETVSTRWGKVGTAGQSKDKNLASPEAAVKDAEKQIKSKQKKGYLEETESDLDDEDFSTWEHPRLGIFEFEPYEWFQDEGELEANFYFTINEEEDEDESWRPPYPSPGEVELACKVYDGRAKLTKLTAQALWDDFHGCGPGTGMWWHNSFGEVVESLSFSSVEEPKSAKDLEKILRFNSVTVSYDDKIDGKPLVQISFGADFEDEHGVGALTDGQEILGLGYSGEARAFPASVEPEDPSSGEDLSLALTAKTIWPSEWSARVFPRRGDKFELKGPESIFEVLKEKINTRTRIPSHVRPSMAKSIKQREERHREQLQNFLSELKAEKGVELKICQQMMHESNTSLPQWIPYLCHHHGLQATLDIYVQELGSNEYPMSWRTQKSVLYMETIEILRRHVAGCPEPDYTKALGFYKKQFSSLKPVTQAVLYFLFQEESWRPQLIEKFCKGDKALAPYLETLLLSEADMSPFEALLPLVGQAFIDTRCAPGLREHLALHLQERILEVYSHPLLFQKGLDPEEERYLAETLASIPHPLALQRLVDICGRNKSAKTYLTRATKNFPQQMSEL